MAHRALGDDQEDDQAWRGAMREKVEAYLEREGVTHGEIGERPAWHVAPCVSVWAIESVTSPGSVGWWVLCGDLPTDYVSGAAIEHPRAVLGAIAERWLSYCRAVRAGTPHEDFEIDGMAGSPEGLLPLLEARARLLAEFAADDELWEGV